MANRANDTYSFPALDVSKVAGADKTVGTVDAVTGGGVVLWLSTTASGDTGTVRVFGPANLLVATGVAIDCGDLVYWNASTGVTVTNTDTPLGLSLADKAAGAGLTEAQVLINAFES
ncbi:MAG: DUF2190 family protein [Anaerolineae bacterium]|nr:DUF2190 family protein [Anaerolineae bacterium]